MRKIFFTGAIPAVQHGVAVNGVDDKELLFLRRQVFKGEAPSCSGTSMTLKLCTLGDPVWKLACAPILMYAGIVWNAVSLPGNARISICTILKYWKVVKPSQVTSWKASTGPLQRVVFVVPASSRI